MPRAQTCQFSIRCLVHRQASFVFGAFCTNRPVSQSVFSAKTGEVYVRYLVYKLASVAVVHRPASLSPVCIAQSDQFDIRCLL